jgi:putative transposase
MTGSWLLGTCTRIDAIDRIYTKRPFFGVRRIWKTLRDDGYLVNPKRVHRLMQQMGLQD